MSLSSAEQDFTSVEPHLWRALSALARNGFVAGPGDARDLVHDFFLDAWPGVKDRFDPGLGSFPTYLTAAFYRFARRRIAKLHSWRLSLVDADEFQQQPSDWPSPADALEQRQQFELMGAALARLPSRERSVLEDYLSDASRTERAVAARHGLTRYALRETLVDAVGRLAVNLGRLKGNEVESLVAYYLWKEGRSPKNVGDLLGLAVPDVQRHRSSFANRLLASIRSRNRTTDHQGEDDMTANLETLRRVLLEVNNADALRYARERAPEFRAALDDADFDFSEAEAKVLEEHPEWLASVYEAVGTAADASESARADDVLEHALASVLAEESREVGDAFAALLDVLPGEFADWRSFANAESVHPAYQEHVRRDPSFESNSGRHYDLATLGLTPMVFLGAARGLELLFDRALEQGDPVQKRPEEYAGDFGITVSARREHTLRQARLQPELVEAQVRTTPGMPPELAGAMTRWMLSASQYRPLMVRGYEATVHAHHISFGLVHEPAERVPSVRDLVWRWSSPETGRLPETLASWSLKPAQLHHTRLAAAGY